MAEMRICSMVWCVCERDIRHEELPPFLVVFHGQVRIIGCMNSVEISGVRYVKASDAAKAVGYTADYVGQLARAGKIDAKQVGRAWYVRDGELVSYKKENIRSNKEKTRAEIHKHVNATETEEQTHHKIHSSIYTPPAVSEFQKRLTQTSVRYESDDRPLVPSPWKTLPKETSFSEAMVDTNSADDSAKSTASLAEARVGMVETETEIETEAEDETQNTDEVLPLEPQTSGVHAVPFIGQDMKKSLSVGNLLVTALVTLVVTSAFLFSVSLFFFEEVIVYDRDLFLAGSAQPGSRYGVATLEEVKTKIYRRYEISLFLNTK